MRTLSQLRKEAEQSAKRTGHNTIHWEPPYANDTAQNGTCSLCGSWIQVDSKPLPNGINISGSVYGHYCHQTKLR